MDKKRRLTRAGALSGNEFHEGECTRVHGPRGGVREEIILWRVNGAAQTWKTRQDEFRVPVKHGMHTYGALSPDNVERFHLPENCPLLETEYRQELDDGRVIEIMKLGGGTLGKRYDGDWEVIVTDRNGRSVFEDRLRTGTPKTHAEAAETAMGFADEGGEA